jgi:hypothetical protein
VYTERWSPRLRQGDVFGPIYYPLSKKAGFQRVSPETSIAVSVAEVGITQLLVSGSERLAVVVSHDCEFSEGKRDHFSIARLQALPRDVLTSDDKLEELRAGNNYLARAREGHPAAIDTFLYEPLSGQFEEPHILNLQSIVPLPIALKEEMLRCKRAELEHEHRSYLRAKVGAFFGRDSADIPEEHKITPPSDPSTLVWTDIPVGGEN